MEFPKALRRHYEIYVFSKARITVGQQSNSSNHHVINPTLIKITGETCESFVERPFTHKVAQTFSVDFGDSVDAGVRNHKYSSTFLTISRIWNGRPLTFENGTASTRYFARIIVQSWPRFISGTITVSKPARTSPRFRGNGFRCRRCADDTLFPSFCIFSTAELIEP